MKTAISIPDDLFQAAERLAKKLKKPRSALYAEAVAEYVARHDEDAITAAVNASCDGIDQQAEGAFTAAAARRILKKSRW